MVLLTNQYMTHLLVLYTDLRWESLSKYSIFLLQIHDPTFAPDLSVLLKETLPALERAVKDGKARFIGLCDYDLDRMKEIIEESDIKISTVLSYAKSTLHDNRLQNYMNYFKVCSFNMYFLHWWIGTFIN